MNDFNYPSKGVLLNITQIRKLPNAIGVYIFKKGKKILYVGKSVSLKARVLSHVENAKLDLKEKAIVETSDAIEYFVADSEFKALLLETALIQKLRPKYNRRWQDDKSYLYIKVTCKESFPKVYIVRRENDNKSEYFGPFPSRFDGEEILKIIRRFYPFCTQKKLSKRPCFYSKIGLCNPCPNEIIKIDDKKSSSNLKKIYRHNIKHVRNVLNGKIDLVLKESYKDIKRLSRQEDYESAINVRNKIIRFEQLIQQKQFTENILDNYDQSKRALVDLLQLLTKYFSKLSNLDRIECYDISNIQFTDATASMVVLTKGLPDKSEYKRFKIKNKKAQSDFEMLEEIFRRRLKHSWKKPDLIVVDGGTPQVERIKRVLQSLHDTTPLIGIAKHPDRLIISTLGTIRTIRPSNSNLGFNLIRLIRDEAHRFAHKYHLLLRTKKMMI